MEPTSAVSPAPLSPRAAAERRVERVIASAITGERLPRRRCVDIADYACALAGIARRQCELDGVYPRFHVVGRYSLSGNYCDLFEVRFGPRGGRQERRLCKGACSWNSWRKAQVTRAPRDNEEVRS